MSECPISQTSQLFRTGESKPNVTKLCFWELMLGKDLAAPSCNVLLYHVGPGPERAPLCSLPTVSSCLQDGEA